MIDAHVHIFPPDLVSDRSPYLARDPWFRVLYQSPSARMVTADQLIVSMDAEGVEQSVVFGFAFQDQGLCRLVNDYVLEAVAAYPRRLVGLCCVSPDKPGAVPELERCLDAGMRGCGELAPDGQGFCDAFLPGAARGESSVARAGLGAVAACLSERGLPLLVHSNEPLGHDYPGKGRFTPEAALELAAAFPELTIVCAHMGGGLFVYELMPEVKTVLARVHYDTSAVPYLYRPDVYHVAVASAGAGKILFGSDYPLLPPGRYREGLDSLDRQARTAVIQDNARRVYGL